MQAWHGYNQCEATQSLHIAFRDPMFPGTQGYAEQAQDLIPRYEAVPFERKYRAEIGFVPLPPSLVLDIGAGTGADAAWLAAKGHRVVAVEPIEPFRAAGAALHPSSAIEWIDDGLPELNGVLARTQNFDVILLTAVWMHLDESQREQAMPVVARLLAPRGTVFMRLRHGPAPIGRRMFEVSATETIALAAANGLSAVLNERGQSSQPDNRAAGIEWTHLAFGRVYSTASARLAVPS
jgi:SAM-dependent methyltransferase